ncbi:hypothetical protein HDV02_004569 [Globomyces sp. JEL0801]|nr:hypothetical protein HDV02_004569 [Globomyces sp. JEL0801]
MQLFILFVYSIWIQCHCAPIPNHGLWKRKTGNLKVDNAMEQLMKSKLAVKNNADFQKLKKDQELLGENARLGDEDARAILQADMVKVTTSAEFIKMKADKQTLIKEAQAAGMKVKSKPSGSMNQTTGNEKLDSQLKEIQSIRERLQNSPEFQKLKNDRIVLGPRVQNGDQQSAAILEADRLNLQKNPDFNRLSTAQAAFENDAKAAGIVLTEKQKITTGNAIIDQDIEAVEQSMDALKDNPDFQKLQQDLKTLGPQLSAGNETAINSIELQKAKLRNITEFRNLEWNEKILNQDAEKAGLNLGTEFGIRTEFGTSTDSTGSNN